MSNEVFKLTGIVYSRSKGIDPVDGDYSINPASDVVVRAIGFADAVKNIDCVCEIEWFGAGLLLVNNKFVVNTKKRQWRNHGKAKWYGYKTPQQFVEQFVKPTYDRYKQNGWI